MFKESDIIFLVKIGYYFFSKKNYPLDYQLVAAICVGFKKEELRLLVKMATYQYVSIFRNNYL